MTDTEVRFIKKSWISLRAVDPAIVGDLFYSKLFADHPGLRKMFPKKMDEQYTKLMDMLNTIIARLDKAEEMTEDIAAKAIRHAKYGVRPAHYKMVGKAMLWTLKHGIGNDWNPELEKAWKECFADLAANMIKSSELESS